MNADRHDLPDDLKHDLTEAASTVRAWRPEPLAPATEASYAAIVARIERGHDFEGARSPRYLHTVRSAWRRHARERLADTVNRMSRDARNAEALVPEMRRWLREIRSMMKPLETPPGASRPHIKRDAVRELPRSWLRDLWAVAQARRDGRPARNLDALAVLLCSGARPSEIEAGVLIEAAGQTLIITIHGAKVRPGVSGQPWRRVSVLPDDGPVAHLIRLSAGGPATVSCPSGHALSQMVSDLAGDRWGRRVSAYDVRHQRAADARFVFRDPELVAAWLGHASVRSMGQYARIPAGGGVAGAIPVAAEAPEPVRRPSPRACLANESATV